MVPSSYCTQRGGNGVWQVAAKAVWDAEECLPPLTHLRHRLLSCLGENQINWMFVMMNVMALSF